MVELNHLSYSVGDKVILNNVSAQLIDHEITCLIGPNGVGKSTLFNLITKQLQPTTGEIKDVPERIALLAQHNELFEPLTVRELLTIQSNDIDEEVVDLLQLTALLDKQMDQLSGGQRQLAWLGYVLHQKPDLLLLDEPTTYLDLRYQQLFLQALTTLQKQRRFTVLMVLHDLTQAFNVGDNIWLMNNQENLLSGIVPTMLDENLLSNTFGVPLHIVNVEQSVLIVPK
ncbi:ABC transporter ATP-binding protein [Weissella ceti]|uniref:ABC transporter ATP-binding protein n=1 Tax=Weissella ceti TaxID=759620 RepID=A0ABT3E3M5_9LACO|nr:ABC transporter ATP-binding protein [Weissella ceti]MCW0952522.1 ABC transporter ATP-binding protein [Weissella ceti]QVK11811.1 ABC transporter ATP-binding protein [Weissella ceti]